MAEGRYNHAAMLMYHQGVITVSWKNAPLHEDTPGQRVLYSQTTDGASWTKAAVRECRWKVAAAIAVNAVVRKTILERRVHFQSSY